MALTLDGSLSLTNPPTGLGAPLRKADEIAYCGSIAEFVTGFEVTGGAKPHKRGVSFNYESR